MARPAPLYTPTLLALATQLAHVPLDPDHRYGGEAVSRTCGSRLAVSLDIDTAGAITAFGVRAQACAVGQAAAALFAQRAVGRNLLDLMEEQRRLQDWLTGAAGVAEPPHPSLSVLEAVRAHPGRHEAVLLPWRATCGALSLGEPSG